MELQTAPGRRANTAAAARTATSNALAQLLERQHDVITRNQALTCGLSNEMLRTRVRQGGRWQRLLPGVYLAVTGTPTQDQRDTAAVFYAGPGSSLTGAAALRRHGVRVRRTETVDVLVPARRRRQSSGFVTVHLTARPPEQVCYRGPIQFVLPARAVADAACWLDELAAVRAVVADAVQSRMCTRPGTLGTSSSYRAFPSATR